MSATIHRHPASLYPEHLAPALSSPIPRGPINHGTDARYDIDKLLADQRQVWNWAVANSLAVLSVNGDRNGAYLCIAPAAHLQRLFGDECAMIQRRTEFGLATETWLGVVGHIRVFWRDVKCVH